MFSKKCIVDKNSPVVNVVMCGVGGQGVLVASDVLVAVAMLVGLDAKKSEIHGMAQRGGSVISQIRFGKKIFSPQIEEGTANILLSFEQLEAVRYLDFLKSNGVVIINNQQITPLTVFFANIPYPKNVEAVCREKTDQVVFVDGISLSEQLGDQRVLNTILLGVLSNFLEFEDEAWLQGIKQRVPAKTFALNEEAFAAGKAFCPR